MSLGSGKPVQEPSHKTRQRCNETPDLKTRSSFMISNESKSYITFFNRSHVVIEMHVCLSLVEINKSDLNRNIDSLLCSWTLPARRMLLIQDVAGGPGTTKKNVKTLKKWLKTFKKLRNSSQSPLKSSKWLHCNQNSALPYNFNSYGRYSHE